MLRLSLALLTLAACNGDDNADTGSPVDLFPVGDVVDLDVAEDGTVQADLPEAGTYVLVLFSAAQERNTFYGYGDSVGQAARSLPMQPLPTQVPVWQDPVWQDPVQATHAPAPPDSTREFTVWDGSGNTTVTAELVGLTDELVIWNDITTENPLGDIDEETLDGVVERFEGIVLPRTRQEFGDVSDVDDSGRIDVLISYTVNTYGPVAYVSWCDIAELAGCGSQGNGGETIYMSIPDPEGNYGSANAIVEIWAHELNHLVYVWHKYVQNDQLDAQENIYLTEGMSELAQDLTGYNNGNQYIWASAIDMSEYYGSDDYSTQGVSLNDFLRGSGYYDANRDGPLRGGGYLFLRYMFEQAGGMDVAEDGSLTDLGGITWLHDWFAAPELGPDAVVATTGRQPEEVAFDLFTALVVSGLDINDDPRFNFEDRVLDPLTKFEYGVDPYATIHGWLTLTGPPIQPIDQADGQIRAGGVEYLQVTVDQPTLVQLPVDAEALPWARAFRIE